MTIYTLLITLVIFLDSLGYAIYEIKYNKNKLGGISVIILSLIMIILVNYSMFNFS